MYIFFGLLQSSFKSRYEGMEPSNKHYYIVIFKRAKRATLSFKWVRWSVVMTIMSCIICMFCLYCHCMCSCCLYVLFFIFYFHVTLCLCSCERASLPVCSQNDVHQRQCELTAACCHQFLQGVCGCLEQRVPERRPGLGQKQAQQFEDLQTLTELCILFGN